MNNLATITEFAGGNGVDGFNGKQISISVVDNGYIMEVMDETASIATKVFSSVKSLVAEVEKELIER